MGVSVAVAIVVGLVSSFVQSLGLTIQRKSHVQEDLLPLPHRRRPIRRPLWLIGFVIYITSNVFSTIFQLDALPIVILAPLGAVSLIFNALLAKVILGDVFGKMAVVGTGLVTLGAVLIAVFGVVQEEEHSLDELLKLWRRGPFLAFFSLLVAAVVIVLISAHIAVWTTQRQLSPGRIKLDGQETPPSSSIAPSNYASPRSPAAIPFRITKKRSRRWSSPATAVPVSLAPVDLPDPSPKASVRFAVKQSPHNLTIDLPPSDPSFAMPSAHQQRTLTLSGLAFAAASGTLSGMSLVLAKAAVELLVITIGYYRTGKGENQFTRPESWFLVAGLGVGAILQLIYLNYSLTFASPALICPLAFCFFNLSSIFDGLVFYDQFGLLKPYQIALVSIGVAILLLGVWVVALIQPAGQGGVDVGTWVEDDDCSSTFSNLEPSEDATLLGGTAVAEPEETASPASPSPPAPHPQPGHVASPSPMSPHSGQMSPLSPNRRRSRGPRYGSLLPEYDQGHIVPTGFSIGLGAASPGFVLRSEPHGHGHGHHARRGRTQSETQAGILSMMQGGAREEDADRLQRAVHARGEGRSSRDDEDDRRDTEHERRRGSWWKGLFGAGQSDGRIRLSTEAEAEGDGGAGDGD